MSAAVIPFPAPARPRAESYGWLSAASQVKACELREILQEATAPALPDRQAEILAALQRIEHYLSRLK